MPINLQLNNQNPKGRPYKVWAKDSTKGKFIHAPAKKGEATLAVMPCGSHVGAAVVPVNVLIREKNQEEVKDYGKASACPICWEILDVGENKKLKRLLAR